MRGGARVWSGDDGVGDTRQHERWRGDGVAGVMAVVGALQRGRWRRSGAAPGGVGRW
jgi:hypothetical protein